MRLLSPRHPITGRLGILNNYHFIVTFPILLKVYRGFLSQIVSTEDSLHLSRLIFSGLLPWPLIPSILYSFYCFKNFYQDLWRLETLYTVFIGTAHIVCGACRVYETVCPSVCVTSRLLQQRACGGFASVGSVGRKYRSIVSRPALSSTTRSSKCGQCRVIS